MSYDSLTAYVDNDQGWTLKPATRRTARYGIRRPRHNTFESVIRSQAPVLPTDPTRLTPRKACRRVNASCCSGCSSCGSCSSRNGCSGSGCCGGAGAFCSSSCGDLLETKEALCGQCYEPIAGPGQPAWRYAYKDDLHDLLIDSEARDRMIQKAYEDIANQNEMTESKPVLVKALARLYQHDVGRPLKPRLNWTDEDWKIARWYATNAYPYISPAGSVMLGYERPLIPKAWVDNIVRQLGPVYNFMERQMCADPFGVYARPCCPTTYEQSVLPRRPPLPLQQQTTRQTQQTSARAERAVAEEQIEQEREANNQAMLNAARVNAFPPLPPASNNTNNTNKTNNTNNTNKTINTNNTNNTNRNNMNNNRPVLPTNNNNFRNDGIPLENLYSLWGQGAEGERLRLRQAQLVEQAGQERDKANPDYAERVYQAQVEDYKLRNAQNQVRMTRFLDLQQGVYAPQGAL